AGLPLYALFITLAVLRLPAWICAIMAMLTAALLGWIVWGMPFTVTIGSATEGMAFGLWPISWIVLNAVFFHNLTVASGDFDVIKRALSRLTTDRRLQALLVAFSFGALIEGIAGFGAPVAISASILASLGFEPVTAAVLALLVSLGCLAALLRFWRPREVWQFAHESAATAQAAQPRRVMGGSDLPARGVAVGRSPLDVADPPSRIVRAFSMYIVLVLVILIGQMGNLPWWSGHPVGDVKTALAAPANITADFKCGNPGFKLCPQPWIGP